MGSYLAYTFKVQDCNIGHNHNRKFCPFYHQGEDERRRDPRVYRYKPIRCRDYHGHMGRCPRADACTFAHGDLEVLFHPDVFRTQYCCDGLKCTRRFCTFAHTIEQLRPAPLPSSPPILQHNLPLHDQIMRRLRIDNRNMNYYNAPPTYATVVHHDLPLHDQIITRPGMNNRNTNDYDASSSSAAVASPSSACLVQPNLPLHDWIIRGLQINERNANDCYASPSSAAVAPQAMNRVHDPPVVTFFPSAIQRANEDDHFTTEFIDATNFPIP